MPTESQLVKALIIGNSKVGKTHYAMCAARDGFKVLYLDGDVSRPTIQQFDTNALSRLFYLPFGDMVSDSGVYVPRFSLLLRKFLSAGKFQWDDTANRSLIADESAVGHTIVEMNASRFNHEWVIVIDSWTSVSHSIMSAVAMNAGVDLADMDKAGQSIYGNANNMATDMLSRIRTLNCHVIVIAHPDEYVKYKVKKGNMRDAQRTENREIEYARMIPKSISRPHAMTVATYFTDVAWLEVSPMGRRQLNFDTSPEKEGGGRFAGTLPIDEASFSQLVVKAGGVVPKSVSFDNDSALTIIPDWQLPAGLMQKPSVINPKMGSVPAQVQLGGSPMSIPPKVVIPSASLKLKLGK